LDDGSRWLVIITVGRFALKKSAEIVALTCHGIVSRFESELNYERNEVQKVFTLGQRVLLPKGSTTGNLSQKFTKKIFGE
jgi:hypothetical protein